VNQSDSTSHDAGATMELIWLVLTLLAVDLAALLFAVDTRPGFEHSRRRAVAHSPGWFPPNPARRQALHGPRRASRSPGNG
jgi:hypothetical protein